MNRHPVFMIIAPLFHCNGWHFPYVITLLAGTFVCVKTINIDEMFIILLNIK